MWERERTVRRGRREREREERERQREREGGERETERERVDRTILVCINGVNKIFVMHVKIISV